MVLHLVRHGRPVVDPTVPASSWELDPAAYDEVWALRDRLPAAATWYCSPEAKAVATAQLLTDGEVGVLDDLREHERAAGWLEDFPAVVERAFAAPEHPAAPGWEPLSDCRERVVRRVRGLLDVHRGEDLVLVGHGTAWTLVVAGLVDAPPDLARWRRSTMPDLWTLDP